MDENSNKECEFRAFHMKRNKLKKEEFLKKKMKKIMVHKTLVMMMNSQKKISL
jgi:hypothetical protein